jgi:hypothetical protein
MEKQMSDTAMVSETVLRYLVGGEALAIVSMAVYIVKMHKETLSRLQLDLRRAEEHRSDVRAATSSGSLPTLSRAQADKLAQEAVKKLPKGYWAKKEALDGQIADVYRDGISQLRKATKQRRDYHGQNPR